MSFKRIAFLSIILLLGCTALISWNHKSEAAPTATNPKYEKQWEKVDSLEKKGLYRMALTEVNHIFDKAAKDENHTQIIKAVLYELKYNTYLEEDDYVKGIYRLDELIEKAPSPAKEILHSLTAEVYWGYYSSNIWKFQNRTNVVEVELEDIRTWDLRKIAEKVRYHYLMSLGNSKLSKKELIKDYEDIASYTSYSNEMRPTLYDFIAHRALDFFKNNRFNIPGPAETFVLEDPRYFASNTTFLNTTIATTDSLNTDFFAIKLLQELTRFHIKESNTNPLFSVELERLQYLNSRSVHPDKDKLYYDALERLVQAYQEYDFVSEAWYEIALIHNNRGNNYSAFGDTTVRWEKRKAIEICDNTIKRYGEEAYGSRQCMALKNTILQKDVGLNGESAIIPNKKNRISLRYKNVDKMYMKIVPYNYKKYNQGRYNYDKLIEELKSAEGSYTKTLDLKDPKDYHQHVTEILIPELENGFYFIVVSSSEGFENDREAFCYMPLWVSNITFQTRQNKDEHEVLVSDRTSGKPLQGAKVEVTYEKYNYKLRLYDRKTLGVYSTNEDGKFNFIPDKDYSSYAFSVKYNDDTYAPYETVYAYRYYGYESHTTQTHLFTDRKIYRPGQTIYFKGVMVDYDGEKRSLKTNYSTSVTLYDVNHQVIKTIEVKTNEFGSFEGEFTAPFGVLTGQMYIYETHGSTYFRVEEYKRPKFMVEMDPVKGEYKVNDAVKVTGFAQAFAGNRIDGADVKYRITRSTGFGWSYWGWGWRPYYAPKELAQGELTTDENGAFEINFNAIPEKSVNKDYLPVFTYTITVDVTDINGETHSTSTNVLVGYQSLKLSQNLTAAMNNSNDDFIRISTTNLNGEKIKASGDIKITKLKTPDRPYYSRYWSQPDMSQWTEKEFRELFPESEYHNENNVYFWENEREVLKTKFDTEKSDSIPLKKFKAWQPGVYKYEAVAKDKNGIEVKDVYYFTVYNPASTTTPNNDVLWVKNLKNSAEPGDNVAVLIASKEKDLTVNYDIEVKGEVIESGSVQLNDEQKNLSYEVKEIHRGNFTIHYTAVKNNRQFTSSITIVVPYTNKKLDLEFSTFRNKLLPGEDEEWTLTIRNKEGGKEAAELLATMYDASLDELYVANSFFLNIYNSYYGSKYWSNPRGMQSTSAYNSSYYWNTHVSYPYRYFPTLNYHGYNTYYYGRYYWGYGNDSVSGDGAYYLMDVDEDAAAPASTGSRDNKNSRGDKLEKEQSKSEESLSTISFADGTVSANQTVGGSKDDYRNTGEALNSLNQEGQMDLSTVKARSNFNETAFFYPQLTTNENGDVKISFTIPESLTKWKFVGLAHTKDLKIGNITEEVITQKELMVVPNVPRFLREGDQISISSKISNVSEEDMKGKVQLELFDPYTEQSLNEKFGLKNIQLDFEAKAGQSTKVSWDLKVPYAVSAVKYKIVAAAGNFSDGEENVLPILSNRMLVTESLPMPIRGNQSKEFKFKKLIDNKSATLKHHRYTLEFTSNPAWYALQAMPYMMEYPYECSEQTFTRYYSNAIATHIMNSNPKIKKVIEDWGQNSPEAFLSNLQKNQELKSLILEETPWVLDAKSEEQSKRNLSILLDMNRMSKELDKALSKTIKAQSSNGGWPWFPGMPESRYITQHIITGMGHLDHLGIKDVRENFKVWRMVKKGVDYLDGEIVRDFYNAKKYDPDYLVNQHIGYTQIQYLYARSYFPKIGMNNNTKEAVSYYQDQAKKFWLNFNIYGEGMLALAAHRFELTDLASDIVKSLKDRSIQHEEFGMYWKDYYVGYYWYEAPIETQALMIEMFDEVADDQEAVEELKIWLLKEKQTTHWKTTKQTTEAVYALLLKGSDLLASDELVEITVGGKAIEYVDNPDPANKYQVKAEAGTGYFKTAWSEEEVKEDMGKISVKKNDSGIAWGAAYWQYFEDLDKITFAETNLKLNKKLFLVEVTNEGEKLKPVNDKNVVHIGDKLRVRIELRTDRNLEYVHMKDMRASGFEPINVLSRYHYQDGLGYYQATKDAATNFFFDYIPKGTYVFEYDLRVQHKGDFSNGITTIQCMYAPEFTSHSDGIRVIVE